METPQACQHKSLIGCILTALPGCCGCSDKRPLASAYPTYVDGQGMRLRGNRYDRYCWRCRDYWRARQEEDSSSQFTFGNPQSWSFAPRYPVQTGGTRTQAVDPYSPGGWNMVTGSHEQSTGVPHWATSASPDVPMAEPNHRMHYTGSIDTERRDHRARVDQDPATDTHPNPHPRRQRMQENINPFGTREEWESDQYQSPLTGMFTRAWNRYRDVENERRRQQAEAEDQLLLSTQSRSSSQHTTFAVTSPRVTMPLRQNPFLSGPQQLRERFEQAATEIERRQSELSFDSDFDMEPSHSHPNPFLGIHHGRRRAQPFRGDDPVMMPDRSPSPPAANPIDLQVTRPPALTTEDMTISIACRICSEQRSDTLIMPCHHLSICRWCVQILRDEGRERRSTGPAGRIGGQNWRCPMCRKVVESTKRIYLA